uniref:NADH-ubiquinone oxidoreductase chain 1 n=1 Tax=Gorgonocephalus chilensis TaxID=1258644 RepID=A0A3G2WI36_9ECHI|nr:NADH dehydrogenase subunit 1 [Gorgonocephalus chilensis]AYO99627.1 NADH dehydrogenase subunit 1 [Gorgonocephalus chilensis]
MLLNIYNFSTFFSLLNLIVLIVPVLLSVALLTLLERKVLGFIQFRKGPNLVGPLGILQPFADGLKLFIKENFSPSSSSTFLYSFSPLFFLLISLLLWGFVPIYKSGLNFCLSLLFIITLSSLSVYGILGAGWSSNSKYSLLGSVRAVAQVISYEVSFGLILIPLVILVGGWGLNSFFNFQSLGVWLLFPCFPLFIMWYISSLAETNRTPFDLSEGESELVSGYNVEYSGAPFAFFFIGEYANIIFINVISVLLFMSSSYNYFFGIFWFITTIIFKSLLLIFSFLWVRASFPRVRYDQLMMIMWKNFLPISLGLLILYFFLTFLFFGFPSYY